MSDVGLDILATFEVISGRLSPYDDIGLDASMKELFGVLHPSST